MGKIYEYVYIHMYSYSHECVYIASSAMRNYHMLGGLNSRNLFSAIQEARSPRSRCWQVWFLLKPLPFACRWLPSTCPHMILWAHKKFSVLISISYKETPHDLILPYCVLKALSPNIVTSEMLAVWFQHMNLQEQGVGGEGTQLATTIHTTEVHVSNKYMSICSIL